MKTIRQVFIEFNKAMHFVSLARQFMPNANIVLKSQTYGYEVKVTTK